jgi:inner membrane protein
MGIELNHASVKLLSVIGITLGLLLPLSQVENQIGARRDHEDEAERQVAKGWGQNVELRSAILVTPSTSLESTSANTLITIETQEKKRGVFRFPVFTATARTKVTFTVPARRPGPKGFQAMSDRAIFTVRPRAAIQHFTVKDGSGKEVKATLVDEGIRVMLGDGPDAYSQELEFEVVTRGTGPVTYTSASDHDSVEMNGNWTKPKYLEDLLPDRSALSAKGFEAFWELYALPQEGDGPRQTRQIGLSHLWIGTDYAMIERATRYGVLFIALTFLLVLIVEFVGRVAVHPLQYGLIGAALSIFYLLLLAFSESVGFDWAYVISSGAVTALIVLYAKGFVKSARYVRLIFTQQIILSIFFYTLLSLEERSFLVGSIGLFIALAAFMLGTRKVDWYAATVGRT